jgi:hypothetical protein
MKDDEARLLKEIQSRTDLTQNPWRFPHARDVVHELGINEKRAAFIFEKWERNGWYECGISVMAGWLTERGMLAAQKKDVKS